MDLVNDDKKETEELVEKKEEKILEGIDTNLKKFLNMQLLNKEKELDEITEEDIDRMLERIEKINKVRAHIIYLPAEISNEFINLIKEKVKKDKIDLGIIEIDISNKDYSIEKFVKNAKDISYSLRFKINTMQDIKEEEKEFLNSRYGITYIYSDNNYHIDELFSIISKMKNLLQENEAEIVTREKNIKRAQEIADVVFKNFELYIPGEYVLEDKEITFRNGEKLGLPNFRVLEDTSKYAEIKNIFIKKLADYKGMRKICKECLRLDGYETVERVSSIGNTVGTEMIIDGKYYGIDVSKDGIKIVSMN